MLPLSPFLSFDLPLGLFLSVVFTFAFLARGAFVVDVWVAFEVVIEAVVFEAV